MIFTLAIRKQLVIYLFILLPIFLGTPSILAKSNPDNLCEFQEDPEAEYWEKTRNTHTVDAYKKYILLSDQGKFTGKYTEAATKAIKDIWDETAWIKAKKKNTPAAYREYVENEPYGKYKKEALKLSGKTSTRTRSSSSAAPPKPSENTGTKSSNIPARKPRYTNLDNDAADIDVSRIPLVKEDSVWKSSLEWDSELAYMNYVDQYPDGRFLEEALEKIPMKVSIVRNNEMQGRSSFNLSYAKNPVIISMIEVDNQGKNSRLTAFELLKSMMRSKNLQGDSVYTYSLREKGLVARMDMTSTVDSKLSIQANQSSAFKIQFRDAMGRTAEISLEAVASAFKLGYISGYSIDKDTLFFKIKGGKPAYTVQFFELDRYIVRHEAELVKDHLKGDPELWYLDKNKLKDEAGLVGEYYLSIWDKSKERAIEHNRIVHFSEGLFSNVEDIILFLIVIMFLILPASWLYLRHKKNKQPRFEPIR